MEQPESNLVRDSAASDAIFAQSEDVPAYVLPFSVTQSGAQEILAQYFLSADKSYVPKDFKPEVEHVQGVYVPYYLLDVQVESEIGAPAVQEGENDNEKPSYFAMRTHGTGTFYSIPLDASVSLPDTHTEAVLPFDVSQLQPATPELLGDYVLEEPDADKDEVVARAAELARNSMLVEGYRHLLSSDNARLTVGQPTERWADTTVKRMILCRLPVWLLTCTWYDEELLFAVNGQTGKCVGNLPVDEKKREDLKFKDSLHYMLRGALMLVVVFCVVVSMVRDKNVRAASPLLLIVMGIPAFIASSRASMRKKDEERMRKVRTARKATSSKESQARQEIEFGTRCIRPARDFQHAANLVGSRAYRPDERERSMAEYARYAYDTYVDPFEEGKALLKMKYAYGSTWILQELPFGQDVMALHDDMGTWGHGYGYALLSGGLFCRARKDGGRNSMSWELLATSSEPALEEDSIVCDGMVLAYAIPEALREPMLHLYGKLQAVARSVYSPEGAADMMRVVEQANRSRRLMKNKLRFASCNFAAKDRLRSTGNSRRELSVKADSKMWLIHMNVGQRHPQSGFAITDDGIFCREPKEGKSHFVSWLRLCELDEPTLDATLVKAGDVSLVCYEGDREVRDALLDLCCDLWRIMRDEEQERLSKEPLESVASA